MRKIIDMTHRLLPILMISTCLLACLNGAGAQRNLKMVAEWQELEFQFPSPEVRESAITEGKYVSGNGAPIDADVDYRERGRSRIFVTIPRFLTGVPITLGTVTGDIKPHGPAIKAYPDYSWQCSHGENCTGITSVFRVAIDECKRLWVLDTGRIGDMQHCHPQILVFNLRNDQLIHRYKIPLNQIKPGSSLLVTPVVDVRDPPPLGQCRNTVVYMADVTGFGILVYNLRLDKSWRVNNKLVYPHPPYGTFTIAGESFDLMDGILGMALSPRRIQQPRLFGVYGISQNIAIPESDRLLYFHALASVTENVVATRLLDNATAWEHDPEWHPRSFYEIGSRGTQSAAQAMNRDGILFFGLMNPIAIACWNTNTPYDVNNIKIVAQNDETLQFASGIKIVLNGKGMEELWVLTCRFQKIMTGSITSTEVNFRIQALQVDELLGGTQCIGPSLSSYSSTNY